MRVYANLAVVLFFFGCNEGINLKSVDYNNLLNDNNSKVWIVNKQIIKNVNIAPSFDIEKDVIVFHESGVINLFPLKGLGSSSGKHGVYHLNSRVKSLEFLFKDEKWIMNLEYINEDSLYLTQTDKSEVAFDLQLKPFPEFNFR